MTRKLHISDSLALPLDAFLTGTQAILAKKGSGKSYTASVEAEELLAAHQQVVVIDPTGSWWGLRSSPDGRAAGYSIAVLGGEHADVPLETGAGEVVAEIAGVRYHARPVEIGSRERMAMLEHTVDVLDTLARSIAHWGCYSDEGDDCSCAVCQAQHALASLKDWRVGGSMETPSRRFEGAMHRRIEAGWDQRETKIHRAWSTFATKYAADPDRLLALILTDKPGAGLGAIFQPALDWPSARDWYVATSIVQWLATTVGSSILEAAGWQYTQHDEDRALRETKRQEAAP